jgi:thiol-disulfide isomerase/thioredoxin
MIKYSIAICCFVLAFLQVQAQNALQISPAKPERGQTITITYNPDAKGATINSQAKEITVVFTYSTFYELPWRMPLKKEGNLWKASFTAQRYATYATFYLQSGETIDKPAAEEHYHIAIYAPGGNKRVENGYLHESYSLSAQKLKSTPLAPLKLALLDKELTDYPNNYEAKVSRLSVLMNAEKDAKKQLAYREQARKIIAAKLDSDPTAQGNMNKVTMGYLMIGEKSRLDSVRRVIRARYPNSDLGKDLTASIIAREKDPKIKIQKLEALLQNDDPSKDGSNSIHGQLFEAYASLKDSTKAIYHASKMVKMATPYLPQTYKEIAETLTENQIAPGTALAYIQKSLAMVNDWPVGIIRFFPEFGHIPSFVEESQRAQAVADAKSELFALAAKNMLQLGRTEQASGLAAQAMEAGNNRTAMLNVAQVYETTKQPQQAFDALWKILLKNPSDTTALKNARKNFMAYNNSEAAFNEKVKALEAIEHEQLTAEISKKIINKPLPGLTGITDLSGKAVTANDLKGKIVILNFWATWCVPCMQEMPYFQQVYNRYKDNPNVRFMVVNSGANNTIEDARKWAKENTQYSFPIYFNNDKNIGEKIGFAVIPTIAVLDKDGKLQFRTVGFEGAILEKKLPIQIEMLLEKSK